MDYKYNFTNKKESKKKIIFFIVIITVAVIISSFFFKNSSNKIIKGIASVINTPFGYITNGANSMFSSIGKYFSNLNNLEKENELLKSDNNELKLKLLESNKVLDENESLKVMLDIKNTYTHFKLKHGSIIIRNHDNFSQTFTIDIGSNDGIKLYQAVIHKDGLVGYISRVNTTSSVVTTILDPRTSVSVTISTINEPAVLKGNLELKATNNLKLEYIPIDSEISIGDMLYTSGLGSMFPSSIPVGRVINIINKKNDSDRYATVEPTVKINNISEVSVILD